MSDEEIQEVPKLQLYKADSGAYRVLVNGKVDPRLVGFQSTKTALIKSRLLFPGELVHVPEDLKQDLVRDRVFDENGQPVD